METKTTVKSLVNITVLLTSLPAIVYLSVYLYEFFQCSFYKIPYEWISIDTSIILKFGYSIFIKVIIASTALIIIILGALSTKYFENLIVCYLVFNVAYILGSLLFLAYVDWDKAFLFIAIAYIILLNGIFLYSDFKGEKSSTNVPDRKSSTMYKLTDIFILALCFLTPVFSIIAGMHDAENRIYYQFIVGKSYNQIVLKKYGEYLITSEYNPKKNTISDTLLITKIKDNNEIKVIEKIISPLKFMPTRHF